MSDKWQPVLVESVEAKRGVRYVGYVQQRRPAKVRRFGGAPFASWIRREVGGVLEGAPLEFADYRSEQEARAHIAYALRKLRRA